MAEKPSDKLSEIKTINERMRCLQEEIERIKSLLCYPSREIKPEKLTGGPLQDNADEIIKLIELESQLKLEFNALGGEWHKVNAVIQKLEDIRHRTILSRYYILDERLDDIGAAMNYSKMQIFRIKEEAIIKYNEKYNEIYKDDNGC